jgi:adenylate kinase
MGGTMNIILLGAPGSGKGTQAEALMDKLGLLHLATGNLFREHLSSESDLGKLAQTFMSKGELVPDKVTIEMVRERLSRPDAAKGVLFDGFPRTVPQAEALDTLLAELGQRVDGAVLIDVADQELIERLSGRMICRECQRPFHKKYQPFTTCPEDRCEGQYLYQRDDDKRDTVIARLGVFQSQTAPVIEFYLDAGILLTVPGEGPVDEITVGMMQAIERIETVTPG